MNLKSILEKNGQKVRRIVVSLDFMKALQSEADLVDISKNVEKESKLHEFNEIHATYTEDNEYWTLWGFSLMFSNSINRNAIIELNDDTSVVIEGISQYKK